MDMAEMHLTDKLGTLQSEGLAPEDELDGVMLRDLNSVMICKLICFQVITTFQHIIGKLHSQCCFETSPGLIQAC